MSHKSRKTRVFGGFIGLLMLFCLGITAFSSVNATNANDDAISSPQIKASQAKPGTSPTKPQAIENSKPVPFSGVLAICGPDITKIKSGDTVYWRAMPTNAALNYSY